MTVAITRLEHTAAELRHLAGRSDDAARLAGMDRQTLRDWVHRYNADGLRGLSDRHGGGVARRLSADQEAAVAGRVRTGPDVAVDKVVRWRCVDIHARIADLFGVALHERSGGKLLRRPCISHMSTRPRHPRADAAARASFGAGSRAL